MIYYFRLPAWRWIRGKSQLCVDRVGIGRHGLCPGANLLGAAYLSVLPARSVSYQGGAAGAGANKLGAGVVYKIDTSGQFSVLYTFTGGADGSDPSAGVIVDSHGNLYGTTYYGGSSGYGVVFKISPAGPGERAV
jgi:uncharacterized repeat protein (TIGR03803 family)